MAVTNNYRLRLWRAYYEWKQILWGKCVRIDCYRCYSVTISMSAKYIVRRHISPDKLLPAHENENCQNVSDWIYCGHIYMLRTILPSKCGVEQMLTIIYLLWSLMILLIIFLFQSQECALNTRLQLISLLLKCFCESDTENNICKLRIAFQQMHLKLAA